MWSFVTVSSFRDDWLSREDSQSFASNSERRCEPFSHSFVGSYPASLWNQTRRCRRYYFERKCGVQFRKKACTFQTSVVTEKRREKKQRCRPRRRKTNATLWERINETREKTKLYTKEKRRHLFWEQLRDSIFLGKDVFASLRDRRDNERKRGEKRRYPNKIQ